MITSGIYSITNKENGKVYIGSTVDFEDRWEYHKQDLRRCAHHNQYLQRSWDKYGEDVFEFGILEYLDKIDELSLAEQFWIDIYREENKDLYNIGRYVDNPMRGRTHTEDVKRVLSDLSKAAWARGAYDSEETRQRMSDASCRKHGPMSEEQKQKLREVSLGRKHSEETKRKMSKSHKGKKLSEEHKRLAREGRKGYKHTEETKCKMRAIAKNRSKETNKKISDSVKKAWARGAYDNIKACPPVTKETRRKMSKSAKTRWARARGEIHG